MAAMSRELRTPVNAIIGFSEMIKNELLDPTKNQDYTTYSTDIYSSGRHFLAIINDILDLAKIEAGGVELDETLIDTMHATQSAVSLISG